MLKRIRHGRKCAYPGADAGAGAHYVVQASQKVEEISRECKKFGGDEAMQKNEAVLHWSFGEREANTLGFLGEIVRRVAMISIIDPDFDFVPFFFWTQVTSVGVLDINSKTCEQRNRENRVAKKSNHADLEIVHGHSYQAK